MNEDEKRALLNFISEHWSLFEQSCQEQGENPEAIYEKLGGEPE